MKRLKIVLKTVFIGRIEVKINKQYNPIIFTGLACLIVFFIVSLNSSEGAGEGISVGNFSGSGMDQQVPSGWEELLFNGIEAHTTYRLVEEDEKVVILAVSKGSSSGLIKKMTIDSKKYPVIQWSWKVSNVYEKGDVSKKEGDDYPARIYVTFAYDPEKASFMERTKYNLAKLIYGEYPPLAAINYIWASKAKKGLMVANPYTEKTMMFVVDSGVAKKGQWLSYSRNIVEDYKLAFGEEPPPISGIAIMTDSDNTKESAMAWFGDISFLKRSPVRPATSQ